MTNTDEMKKTHPDNAKCAALLLNTEGLATREIQTIIGPLSVKSTHKLDLMPCTTYVQSSNFCCQ